MPYDDGMLISTAERFQQKAQDAAAQARVDFALYATLHPRDGADFDELLRHARGARMRAGGKFA